MELNEYPARIAGGFQKTLKEESFVYLVYLVARINMLLYNDICIDYRVGA
jgi:hypothetical protein